MRDDGQTTRCPHQNGRRVHQPLTFGRIEHIDPVGALNSWGARVDLDRAARFREIQPFDLDYLG